MAVEDMAFYPVDHLGQVVDHLTGRHPLIPVVVKGYDREETDFLNATCGDFFEVKGQEQAKRAFQISAAGGHDLSLCGPPGVGKSMLAERIQGILPPLSRDQMLEVTKIYNIAGRNPWSGNLVRQRPFRAPHHSTPPTALIGGGARPLPGELTLAHQGVLFLDELPEFERRTLDMLRQPLEEGFIDLSRAGCRNRFPCQFILITAMNPCPCGYYGDPFHTCTCKSWQRQRYLSRISGPLLDRIEIHVDVRRVVYQDLAKDGACLSSAQLREGVMEAAERQAFRFQSAEIDRNAQLTPSLTAEYCRLNAEGEKLLESAWRTLGLSVRQGKKTIRLARTIADIEKSENIESCHIAEAIGLRRPNSEGEDCGIPPARKRMEVS